MVILQDQRIVSDMSILMAVSVLTNDIARDIGLRPIITPMTVAVSNTAIVVGPCSAWLNILAKDAISCCSVACINDNACRLSWILPQLKLNPSSSFLRFLMISGMVLNLRRFNRPILLQACRFLQFVLST